MAFYPAFLDLSHKDCLVIGGGVLALHKTRAFVELGARVTVVAPRVKPDFARLRGVRVVRRGFRPGDLAGQPWLVVAATDDEALHARVAALCRQRRIWVNVVDRPPLCDFIVPSVTRRGPVTFAVSTGGASPAVAITPAPTATRASSQGKANRVALMKPAESVASRCRSIDR